MLSDTSPPEAQVGQVLSDPLISLARRWTCPLIGISPAESTIVRCRSNTFGHTIRVNICEQAGSLERKIVAEQIKDAALLWLG